MVLLLLWYRLFYFINRIFRDIYFNSFSSLFSASGYSSSHSISLLLFLYFLDRFFSNLNIYFTDVEHVWARLDLSLINLINYFLAIHCVLFFSMHFRTSCILLCILISQLVSISIFIRAHIFYDCYSCL